MGPARCHLSAATTCWSSAAKQYSCAYSPPGLPPSMILSQDQFKLNTAHRAIYLTHMHRHRRLLPAWEAALANAALTRLHAID